MAVRELAQASSTCEIHWSERINRDDSTPFKWPFDANDMLPAREAKGMKSIEDPPSLHVVDGDTRRTWT